MGVWRTLGYIFAGLTILGGFILIAFGASLGSQTSSQTGLFGNAINQLVSLALVYGGVSTIVLGILIIWALVKSGQIENIDKNIEIIAEWTKSQKEKEGKSDDDQRFLEDQQRKLDEEERYVADLERKKKDKEELKSNGQ
jgi:hypothetical protein